MFSNGPMIHVMQPTEGRPRDEIPGRFFGRISGPGFDAVAIDCSRRCTRQLFAAGVSDATYRLLVSAILETVRIESKKGESS